jgi:hypothetical protein
MLDDPPLLEVTPGAARSHPVAEAPRLGIIHLMVWMFGSAVILAIVRATTAEVEQAPMTVAAQAIFSLVTGVSLGAVLIWIGRLVRGVPAHFGAPGHFLLLLHALMIATQALAFCVLYSFEGQSWDPSFSLYTAVMILGILVRAAVAITAAVLSANARTWQFAFGLMAAGMALEAFPLVWSHLDVESMIKWDRLVSNTALAIGVSTAVAMIAAIILDVRRRRRHDWLHVVGVTISLLAILGYWLLFAVMLFIVV